MQLEEACRCFSFARLVLRCRRHLTYSRFRRQKCDAVRPVCGTCKRDGRECTIREPLVPRRKKKNLQEVVDALEARLAELQGGLRASGTSRTDGKIFLL